MADVIARAADNAVETRRGCGPELMGHETEQLNTGVTETVEVMAVGLRSPSMAVVIRLFPLDERGREIIDELEEKTEVRPRHPGSSARLSRGGRMYDLPAEDVSVEVFDAMLTGIDSDWREHVTRTSSILR